jgi:hypothetical protein
MTDTYTKLRYTILDDGTAIKCHFCNLVSHNIDDVRQRYCGNCMRFHEDEQVPIPPHVKAIAESIAMTARTEICQGREVAPQIFVLNTAKGLMTQPTMRMGDPEDRDLMAQETRLLADEMDADAVILLSEAWAQQVNTPAKMAALRAQYGGRIANMPGLQEILLLTVETADQYWQGKAPITGAGLDRRCGDVQYAHELAGQEHGRFTHFLASPADKAQLATTLAKVRAILDAKGFNPEALVNHDGTKRGRLDILRRLMVKNGQFETTDLRLQLVAGFLASLAEA